MKRVGIVGATRGGGDPRDVSDEEDLRSEHVGVGVAEPLLLEAVVRVGAVVLVEVVSAALVPAAAKQRAHLGLVVDGKVAPPDKLLQLGHVAGAHAACMVPERVVARESEGALLRVGGNRGSHEVSRLPRQAALVALLPAQAAQAHRDLAVASAANGLAARGAVDGGRLE